MAEKEMTREEVEALIGELIGEWYLHLEEHPDLHKFIAESLARTGVTVKMA